MMGRLQRLHRLERQVAVNLEIGYLFLFVLILNVHHLKEVAIGIVLLRQSRLREAEFFIIVTSWSGVTVH